MGNDMSAPAPAVPVLRLGGLASSTLASGSNGRVLAATSRAIYLLPESGELLWLADGRSNLHRRCAQVAGLIRKVVPGADWVVVGQRLEVGGRAAFDLSSASPWGPPPVGRRGAVPPAHMISCLVGAVSWLTRRHAPHGLGVLLPRLLDLAGYRLLRCSIIGAGPAAVRAWPAIRDIFDSSMAHDLRAALRRADGLVGLGEGLTPSGDDFVGGLLYSLVRLNQVSGRPGHVDASMVDGFLRAARSRTNAISYTLLADHARGHASDALEQFVDALLTGQVLERTERRGAQLIRLGHSTGWDLLTGVTLGILAAAGKFESRRPVEVSAAHLLHS